MREPGTVHTVKQIRPANEAVDAGHIDDGRASGHVGDSMLGHVEVLETREKYLAQRTDISTGFIEAHAAHVELEGTGRQIVLVDVILKRVS